jgi:hypothetical protein
MTTTWKHTRALITPTPCAADCLYLLEPPPWATSLQVVVVLSGSMEPGFHRGDILFLNMGTAPIRTGEIVVFNLDGRDIPIVHRVIKVHERSSKDHIDILTKVGCRGGDC